MQTSTHKMKMGQRRPTDNPSAHEEPPAVVDVTNVQPVGDDRPRAKCNFHAKKSHKKTMAPKDGRLMFDTHVV